jgi:hypothetical protein
MQRTALTRALKARFHPTRWSSVLAFIVLLVLWRLMEGESLVGKNSANHALILVSTVYLFTVTPIPWQWTGDGRRIAPFLRGLLQSLAWNTLLLLPLLVVPFLAQGPDAIFGHPNDLSGQSPWSLALGWSILSRALFVAVPAGWFFAREEAAKAAKAESEAIQRTLETSARQAQMLALQTQLDPHVLYNALSGISELVHEDPHKADEALVSLSRLYRRLTTLGRQDLVPLHQERELIQDYLHVEQIRLGARLRIQWDWSGAHDALLVPPLLIQPLVENAIKHGLAPLEEGGELRISLRQEDAAVRVTVSNNGLPLDPTRSEGTGLANLKARLALFGNGSSLSLETVEGWTVAELDLKLMGGG